MKFIRFLHPRYHPKIREDILKNETSEFVLIIFYGLMTMKWRWIWNVDHIDATLLDVGLDLDTIYKI